jgi:hypothetical protein
MIDAAATLVINGKQATSPGQAIAAIHTRGERQLFQ